MIGGTVRDRASRRQLWLGVMLFIALLASSYWRNIHTGATNSGVIAVYGTDPLGALALAGIAVSLVFRWGRQHSVLRRYLPFIVAFFGFAAAVTALRYAGGHADLQSLQLPRANLASIWILLLVLWLGIGLDTILAVVAVFSPILSVAGLMLCNGRWPIAYVLWQNHSIRTIILAALLPLVALATVRLRHTRARAPLVAVLAFHAFAAFFCLIVSGQRLNAFIVPVAALAAIVLVARRAGRGPAAVFLLGVALAFPAIHLAQGCSPAIRYGVERTPLVGVVLGSPPACYLPMPSGGGEQPVQDDIVGPDGETTTAATASKQESTQVRLNVWRQALADVLRNPVFGVGYRQYTVPLEVISQREIVLSTHNFVLDYTLAYGVIGLLLWLAMVGYPIVLLWRRRRSPHGRTVLVGVLLSLLVLVAIGLLQPILINPTVLCFLYLALGVGAAGAAATADEGSS